MDFVLLVPLPLDLPHLMCSLVTYGWWFCIGQGRAKVGTGAVKTGWNRKDGAGGLGTDGVRRSGWGGIWGKGVSPAGDKVAEREGSGV